MAVPEDLQERLNNIAYCAVLDYYRCFMATDGPNLLQIAADGLTPEIADRIALEYRVRRNISDITDASGREIPGVTALVDAIEQSAWPDSLSERADVCIAIAKAHCDGVKRRGQAKSNQTPTSAVTKLMWFRRPEGWTMFDKQARLGLIGNKNCAKAFYMRLEELDFQSLAADITRLCGQHSLSMLRGERIIDKILMFRSPQADLITARSICFHHCQLLPTETAKALFRLADAVETRLRRHPGWRDLI